MASNYSSTDNVVHDRGHGEWTVHVYKPEEYKCGPYVGTLSITKDFHTVTVVIAGGRQKCIASIPSQNVAFVEDMQFMLSMKQKPE